MKSTYTYSLLQYHHSMILGEVLNIGMILYFSKTNEIKFIYPKDFSRAKSIYPNFPEKTIMSYFRYFKNRVDELNKTPNMFYKYELGSSIKKFIDAEFLPADSSMLQFKSYNKGILYTNNLTSLLKKLFTLYFPSDSIEIAENLDNAQIVKTNFKLNKQEWISPDIKNKITKLDKNDVFLPSQDELSFLK